MIALDSVARGSLIGVGGFGQVFRVEKSPIPSETRALVFKEPRPDLDTPTRSAVLRGMADAVNFRAALRLEDRAKLDEISAWPIEMVYELEEPRGCLMPLIPANYFTYFKGTSGLSDEQGIVNLGALSWDELSRSNIGLDAPGFDDDVLRLLVLNKLAEAVAFLHKLGRVYGDLNPNNVAICMTPPSVLLMDCDATGSINDVSRIERQGHFPSWTPPEHDRDAGGDPSLHQGFSSDVYKLALAYVKSMTPGPGATQRVALPDKRPGVFDDGLLRVLASTLEAQPNRRVSAEAIAEGGKLAAALFTAPPRLSFGTLSRSRVVRGQDVEVSWRLEGPAITSLTLIGADSDTIAVPVDASHSMLRVSQSGPVSLRVQCRYSMATFILGRVECFELPAFSVDRINLPVVHLPELPRLAQTSSIRAIQAIPVPTITAPDSSEQFNEMAARLERIGSATSALLASAKSAAAEPVTNDRSERNTLGAGRRIALLVEALERHVRRRAL